MKKKSNLNSLDSNVVRNLDKKSRFLNLEHLQTDLCLTIQNLDGCDSNLDQYLGVRTKRRIYDNLSYIYLLTDWFA